MANETTIGGMTPAGRALDPTDKLEIETASAVGRYITGEEILEYVNTDAQLASVTQVTGLTGAIEINDVGDYAQLVNPLPPYIVFTYVDATEKAVLPPLGVINSMEEGQLLRIDNSSLSALPLYKPDNLVTPFITLNSGDVAFISVINDTAFALGLIYIIRVLATSANLNLSNVNVTTAQANLEITGLQSRVALAGTMDAPPTNGAPLLPLPESASGNYSVGRAFDQTTQEFAVWTDKLPERWNNGTITFRVFAKTSNTDNTKTAEFALQAVASNPSDSNDLTWGTAQSVTVSPLNPGYRQMASAVSSAITVANSPQSNSLIQFRLKRVVGGGSNIPADVYITHVEYWFTADDGNDA
jgi:hypothetical protein